MKEITVSAKNLNDAITEACRYFSIPSDRLDCKIIDEGKAGFLGFGAKPAVSGVDYLYCVIHF